MMPEIEIEKLSKANKSQHNIWDIKMHFTHFCGEG